LVRGLYTASMGMMIDVARIDNTTNNLANVDSPGFKKDNQAFTSYLKKEISRMEAENTERKEKYIGAFETAVVLDEVYSDFQQGSFVETGNNTDFYINGDSFFHVSGTDEKDFYTKSGAFTINSEGLLTDFSGNYILNNAGETITFDKDSVIDENGNIYVDNVISGRIGIYAFDNEKQLVKKGNNLFEYTGNQNGINEDFESKVIQGGFEKSNVNSIREMVNLIDAQRHFEICQRVITTEDELLNAAVNRVGTIR